MDLGHLAERGGEQPHAMEGQHVLQIGGVGQPAAEPVHGLADDDVEAALSGVGGELLKARSEAARAAQRS
ncbi:hypothetical protein ABEG18_08610 [Alsobacter sp. KACC 23698]|uniref:Uncharacterized protein n=1 Tax=Alsobacter sp. KACC 23698 TaxID=3149229 RepID=A0AAU7JK49_9HYPH